MSEPPYDTANLSASAPSGEHGDDPVAVEENRAVLASALGLSPADGWWWLRQAHGTEVVVATGPPPPTPPTADAAVTTVPGLPLVVLTADCAPVVLACDDAVGVAHAGWPGLLAGVVEAAVATLRSVGHGPVRATLGPCIHPEHYEFGRDDLDRVVARLGPDVESVTADGRPALDVPAAVRIALDRVEVDVFEDLDVCTATSPDHFSYRRDGVTGRQALVAVLTA